MWWVRWLLIGVTLVFLGLFLFVPLLLVFTEAFSQGWTAYVGAISTGATWSAVRLTLLVAAIVVPINSVFGVIAAWAIAKFQFAGKSVLITLLDLPYSVSPVIAGMIFVLLFGRQGWFGPWLEAHDFHVIFSTCGIVLATLFVTFPFVARELIPLMQAPGNGGGRGRPVLGAGGAANVLAGDAAEHQVGPALRRDPLQRPRDGRVRRRLGGRRPSRQHEHDAAARANAVRGWLRSGPCVRRRLAFGHACPAYPGAQVRVTMENIAAGFGGGTRVYWRLVHLLENTCHQTKPTRCSGWAYLSGKNFLADALAG